MRQQQAWYDGAMFRKTTVVYRGFARATTGVVENFRKKLMVSHGATTGVFAFFRETWGLMGGLAAHLA